MEYNYMHVLNSSIVLQVFRRNAENNNIDFVAFIVYTLQKKYLFNYVMIIINFIIYSIISN